MFSEALAAAEILVQGQTRLVLTLWADEYQGCCLNCWQRLMLACYRG